MRISAFSILALGFGLVSVQLAACGTSTDDCSATATCAPTGGSTSAGSSGKSGGGSNAGGDSAGAHTGGAQNTSGSGTSGTMGVGGEGGAGATGCSGDVADDAACWTTNELGVFVSSEHGSDATGDGTKENPFATITKGAGAAAGKNVYVCLGDSVLEYDEQLVIDGKTMDGLHIYGGFSCEDWSYDAERKPLVHPKTKALPIALRILGTKKGVSIESMRFQAADATGTGLDASSYGAFVTDSTNVVLKGVTLTAGAGMKGEDQGQPEKQPDGTAATSVQDGKPPACVGGSADGGVWPAAICGSAGGDGGKAVTDGDGGNGFSGTPSKNVTPPDEKNLGAGATTAAHGGDGTDGSTGNMGAIPKAGPGQGTFAAAGFSPASGAAGGDGFPGQGGGGGGASQGAGGCRGASGGAGGMGGCGGIGAKGGGGGGTSVGLLSWNSAVTLSLSLVASGSGGAGGNGGKGGAAGAGVKGGTGGGADTDKNIERGGDGGRGGNGGNGGSGAGGSGGPSFAIVFSGIKPSYDLADTTLKPGLGGAKGTGGGAAATKAPDGSVGASDDFLEL